VEKTTAAVLMLPMPARRRSMTRPDSTAALTT
jgi:hypothetical protein